MLRQRLVRIAEALRFYREFALIFFAFSTAVFIIVYKTEFHPIILENIEMFVAATISVLGLATTLAATIIMNRRKEKRDIAKRVYSTFVDVAAVAARETPFQVSEDDKLKFYSGEKVERRFWEFFIEELDFIRPALQRMKEEFSAWNGKSLHKCPIPAGEKQGKSILAGRFAWELAKSTENKVLWWTSNTAVSLAELSELILDYRKYLSKTKKLVVFMDDLLKHEEGEEYAEPGEAYNFLQKIHCEVFLVFPSNDRGQLKFESDDFVNLIDKLMKRQLIQKAFAERLLKDAGSRKSYLSLPLCRCMNLLALRSGFMQKSQIDMLNANLPAEEDKLLRKVSLCSVVSLPYPDFIFQNVGAELWRRTRIGFLADFLKEEEFETGEGIHDLNVENRTGDKGLVLTTPLFAAEILRERYGIRNVRALSEEFEKVLFEILSSAHDRFQNDFAMEYLRVVFCRLARNLHRPFYPEFRGQFLAQAIFAKPELKKAISHRMDELADFDQILRWASAFRWISDSTMEIKLVVKAEQIARRRGFKSLDLTQVIQLAMRLRDANDSELKEKAATYFENAIAEISQIGSARVSNQVIDAYIDLLTSLKGSREALDKLDRLLEAGKNKFMPDAVLVRRRAQLLDDIPERVSEAHKEFKTAIELAKRDPTNMQSVIITIQRFAVFLSEREALLDAGLREDPDVYFKEAAELAKESGFGYETVLNAWAVHKEERGDIEGANSLYDADLEYCDRAGLIHPPTLLGYAGFLHRYGGKLGQKAWGEWWQMAEDCCRKIINYEEVDHRSRLYAYHQLGLLIGSAPPGVQELPNGDKRPDFPEATKTVGMAFESPEALRTNESRKTFQDCIAHKSLAQIYSRWIDAVDEGSEPETEPIAILQQKIGFHSYQAFSGLSGRLNLTREMKEHLVDSQIGYAGFQWFRNRDPKSAKANYDESITNLEHWGLERTSHRLSCRAYWHVANFYSYLYKKSSFVATEYLDYSVSAYKKALEQMPLKMPLGEKSRLRFKSSTSIYQQMRRLHLINDVVSEKQRHVEASRIIEEGLAEDPPNPWLWSGRVLLSLWEGNLQSALHQLIQRRLETLNKCLMTLIRLNQYAAAKEVCVHLLRFQDELKQMLIAASLENRCSFFSLLSVLNRDLGSSLLTDPKIREDLQKKLGSLTATSLASAVQMLVKASRIESFLDLCLTLDYQRIVSSSTLPSIHRVLARFGEIQDTRYGTDKKNAGIFGLQVVKALQGADLVKLTARKDATLFRLNGIIDNATNLDRSEAAKLVQNLGNVRLNPLFLKVDPAAQGRGISQVNVVNLFISGRASISPIAASNIVNSVPEHDFVHLIREANDEGNVKGAFYLLWNVYRYGRPKAMRIAYSVAGQLLRPSCDELESAIIKQVNRDRESAQHAKGRLDDEPSLIRLAIFGLLRRCNVNTREAKLSNANLEVVKRAVKGQSLTIPLLSLVAIKAELGSEQFQQIKKTIDWEQVKRTIRSNEDQNLRMELSSLVSMLADNH